MKEKIMQNNSQVKINQKEVEDHYRISSVSNKTKSVTACNDTLKSRASNVKAVCATCGNFVFNSNHDLCVSKFINDVNARTKKPNVVSVSDRKPRRSANQSVATPRKRPTYGLSHLNFDTINLLSKKDIVNGLPKLKYVKDQLCSSCKLGKAKRSTFKTKHVPSSKGRLNLLHMDLCGHMRIESINGKKYIMVIVDDYSTYTWTYFFRSKDETPEMHSQPYEFFNLLCTPVQEVDESSSRNIDNSNMHTLYQRHRSDCHWTKDHPLKQVRRNSSKPVQTRRQLSAYPKMCTFVLTVSTIEPKNIKEAMVDHTWIEAMQKELFQFDSLEV
nr:Gag-Pol polyprotein [Tanacetum cinerariifolium]GEY93282.1 Gag-Pol polyprotein [Tanacetum cinerariifolium]